MKKLLQIFIPLLLTFLVISLLFFFLNLGEGINAIDYYAYIFKRTLSNSLGFQAVIIKMTPLLCISAGLMLAFKAGLWNLGIDGQFFLGAVFCSGIAPYILDIFPNNINILSLFFLFITSILVSFTIGVIWGIIPAYLHIKHKINEVITSLMMTFIGLSLGNIFIKSFFKDMLSPHPQTIVLPVEYRLPSLFDTRVHIGFILAIFLVLFIHYILKNTPIGLKLRIMGVNRKAAIQAGYPVNLMLCIAFICSSGIISIAGAIEVLGVNGHVQANWNPQYSMLAIPLIFLSRSNGFLIIFFAFLFSILLVGGESAARIMQIPTYITSVSLALIMLFSAFTDALLKR